MEPLPDITPPEEARSAKKLLLNDIEKMDQNERDQMSDHLFNRPKEESKDDPSVDDSHADSAIASEHGTNPIPDRGSNGSGSTALVPSANIQDHYTNTKQGMAEK